MDYRGIITRGYHVDAGGQNHLRIVSMGYISLLSEINQIFNIIESTAHFQIKHIKNIMFGMNHQVDTKFTKNKIKEVLF